MVMTNEELRTLGENFDKRQNALKNLIKSTIEWILYTAERGGNHYEQSYLSKFWDYDFIQEYYAGVRKEFPEIQIVEELGGSNPDVRYFTFSWD
jgi:hypothetical protein